MNNCTILHVEDNPQNMRLVHKMLAASGYKLLEAPDGITGLEMTCQCVPDLILMDINLPDIDGLEVTRRIKATPELRHIPVVALTANAMHGDRERFLNAGCDGYISKPVTRSELLNTIALILERHQVGV